MIDYRPCPSCHDGLVWTSDGPTSRTCLTCAGCTVVHLDGSKMTRAEYDQTGVIHMRIGEVELSGDTASALDRLELGDVGRVNLNLAFMAWLLHVLRYLPDTESNFPRGKWATIQGIDAQLNNTAIERAKEIVAERREKKE